jgi:hypothetical protein
VGRGGKIKNQIVAAFKKKQSAVAFKNQIVVAFIVGGATMIAPAIVIIALNQARL